MQKYLWMAVTADEYELPIAVADTAKALGEMLGVGKSNIENCAWRERSGSISGRRIRKVPVSEQ